VTFSHQGKEYEEDFDALIGADGAWSKVRPLLTETKPHFSGINCITLTIPHISSRYLHLDQMVGKGSYSATGEKKAVMSQRGTMDSARLYLMLSSASSSYLETPGLRTSSPSELKDKLLGSSDLFASWGKELKELIAAGCDAEVEKGEEIEMRPLYMLPIGFTWPHNAGATIIGDAAHLMTPFAGEGVNAAMLDASELAQQIIAALSGQSEGGEEDGEWIALDQALRAFEQSMWSRAKDIAADTWENLQIIFADDAPDGFVRMMQSHGPPPEEE
jgi:2-polyprenyl-6-methoxyphenol hydroxylase-like FAD-dependent oxidoreductase